MSDEKNLKGSAAAKANNQQEPVKGEPREKLRKNPPKDPRKFDPRRHEFPDEPAIPDGLEYKLDVIIAKLHNILFAIPIGILFLCCGILFISVFIFVTPPPLLPFTPTETPTATPTMTPTSTSTTMVIGAPSETPAAGVPQVTPTSGESTVTFTSNINLREGPGTEYEVVWTFEQGTESTIIGRYDNTSWILVRINDPITRKQCGWVFAELLNIDLSNLTALNFMPDVYDCP